MAGWLGGLTGNRLHPFARGAHRSADTMRLGQLVGLFCDYCSGVFARVRIPSPEDSSVVAGAKGEIFGI